MSANCVQPPEQVLVIPTSLAALICPNTWGPVPEGAENDILNAHTWRDREEAETNFDFKQVIPYIVVTWSNLYLLSQRTTQQQEKRLHGKFSIGQGGHINNMDFHGSAGYLTNTITREIAEEYTLSEILACEPVGVINDNSTEVARVHLGLVYLMRVVSPEFCVAETDKHTAKWADIDEVRRHYDQMESWSQVLLDNLFTKPPSSP
jgi:predicted NUDIX family phosphoesterase